MERQGDGSCVLSPNKIAKTANFTEFSNSNTAKTQPNTQSPTVNPKKSAHAPQENGVWAFWFSTSKACKLQKIVIKKMIMNRKTK